MMREMSDGCRGSVGCCVSGGRGRRGTGRAGGKWMASLGVAAERMLKNTTKGREKGLELVWMQVR